jgi:mannitol/fructose-specific phosphotransferase system IIA component (Ntr-type)
MTEDQNRERDLLIVMRKVLANIIILDDLLEVVMFSFVVQFAIGKQRGREVSLFDALLHALNEVGLALLLGLVTFLLLKLIITEFEREEKTAFRSIDSDARFSWNIFREHPSQSVQVMFVVVGLLSISVSLAMQQHWPFLLVPMITGMCISNFHTRQLFDSLKMEEVSSFFNLMFFALIGANVHIDAIRADTLIYVVLYILTRTLGKRWGTKLGTRLAKQDLKIRSCLPNLMLPQAGVAAVEAAYVAIVLKNGDDVVNVILPALIFFEIVGVILAEKTLIQWKSWTVGEGKFLQPPSATKPAKQPASAIQLSRILSNEVIKTPLSSTTKEGIILELLELLKDAGKVSDTDHVFRDIMAREKLMSTGIGDGIAIPHGKTSGTTEVLCAFGVKPGGVGFKSIDNMPADIFFLIVSPEDDPSVHLKFLATISHLLQSDENRRHIREFSSSQDAMAFFAMLDESEISERKN